MSQFFRRYEEARAAAEEAARRLQHAVGIERAREYGRSGYAVRLVPNRSEDRYGWEMRCEIVERPNLA